MQQVAAIELPNPQIYTGGFIHTRDILLVTKSYDKGRVGLIHAFDGHPSDVPGAIFCRPRRVLSLQVVYDT